MAARAQQATADTPLSRPAYVRVGADKYEPLRAGDARSDRALLSNAISADQKSGLGAKLQSGQIVDFIMRSVGFIDNATDAQSATKARQDVARGVLEFATNNPDKFRQLYCLSARSGGKKVIYVVRDWRMMAEVPRDAAPEATILSYGENPSGALFLASINAPYGSLGANGVAATCGIDISKGLSASVPTYTPPQNIKTPTRDELIRMLQQQK